MATGNDLAQAGPAAEPPVVRDQPGRAIISVPAAVWDNGMRSLDRVVGRLRRPVVATMPAVVTPAMVSLIIAASALTLFVAAFDPIITVWIRQSDWVVWRFLWAITDAAKSHFYLVPAGVIALAIGLSNWRAIPAFDIRRRLMITYGQCAFIFVAIAGPGIAINIAKQLVGRARPRAFEELGAYGFAPFEFDYVFQSFPSGHSTTAGSLAMVIALWYPRYAALALVSGACLAFARVPANAHYLSDVIAGYSIGTLATLALARWLARRWSVFRFVPGTILPAPIGVGPVR